MNTDEINNFLNYYSKEVVRMETLDKLYELYIDLTVKKSELHKLFHFCVHECERKQYFAMIDLANSVQNICHIKIRTQISERKENLKLDFEVE